MIDCVSQFPGHYLDGVSDHGVGGGTGGMLECLSLLHFIEDVDFSLQVEFVIVVKDRFDPCTNKLLHYELTICMVSSFEGIDDKILIVVMVVTLIF